jgi:hypothetical protein
MLLEQRENAHIEEQLTGIHLLFQLARKKEDNICCPTIF